MVVFWPGSRASVLCTRLTLWTSIPRAYIAMGAAGWHVCFDILSAWLSGNPIGRTVGADATKVTGWQRLHAEYAKQFDEGGRSE